MRDYDKPAQEPPGGDSWGQGLGDILLADIAIRVQLSPTQHRLATERYKTLDQWIQREDSPLHGRVEATYAQGSMSIGATINSRVTDDEFDIDAMTQLRLPVDTEADLVLDSLFDAVRGEKGSRYSECTSRRSRCVTVSYSDGMHVDLTPAIRQVGTPRRQSLIFEHKRSHRSDAGSSLIANPFGFAEWFKGKLPDDHDFSRWFTDRVEAHEASVLAAQPVPPPEGVDQKSRAVVALQLLKRWRNVQHEERAGRRPPSVVLSKLVAENAVEAASRGPGLLPVLLCLARAILRDLDCAQSRRQCIHVANPVCPEDILTDRWPGNLKAQEAFISDLKNFVAGLRAFQRSPDLEERRKILVRLFGEAPALKAIEPHSRAIPRGPVGVTSTGGIIVGAAVAANADCRTVPHHTFHGDGDDGT